MAIHVDETPEFRLRRLLLFRSAFVPWQLSIAPSNVSKFAFLVEKLHEAIMREESTEFEEGIIIEQYRKGFQLGDRLLRPSMVKVSAGPGPTKPEPAEPVEIAESGSETSDEGSKETESPED